MRILWGITGSGDKIGETVSVMLRLKDEYKVDIRVALSRNGEIVARMYEVWDLLRNGFEKAVVEKGPNSPFLVGALQTGKYDLFIVCPATANTTAKIAHGIADSLISNCVSQAIKANQNVYIYPVDQKPGSVTTVLPSGEKLVLTNRQVDLDNVAKLQAMEGFHVLEHPKDFLTVLKDFPQE